ncbi:MAG: cytidylate kinase-like family protein, partial [Coprobacter sp.]|nr:cytidylate kinase-like family protein [Coprobacter sp.]
MKDHLIITIGRQFGSGGRDIGRRLARLFDIAYYDKELIREAARESGLSSEYFEKADETAPRSLCNLITTWSGTFGNDSSLSNENIFKIQSDTIVRLAESGPCVFVGRCADYILRDYPMCVKVFIHAPLQDRIKRITEREGATEKEAEERALKKNRCRADYYNYYTDKEWG